MVLELATPYPSHRCMYQVPTYQYTKLGQCKLHGDMQVISVRTNIGLLISTESYSSLQKNALAQHI